MDEVAALEERVRLLTEQLAEANAQQDATDEVLRIIGSSAFELGPVFDTVVRNAVGLCHADAAQIWSADADGYRIVCQTGGSSEYQALMKSSVIRPGRDTMVGKVALERATVQVEDVLVDPDYSFSEAQKLGGFRTLLGVPMMREGEPIGVITLWRIHVDPFTDEQVELVSTFAAQGALAIGDVQLLRELDDKNRELEVASRHKSEFLAHMSHELRTPLNAVIGFSEVLLERMFGDLNERQEEYLNDILSSGRHLLALINDVLDVAKVEAGRIDLEIESVALDTLLENALMLVREQAAQRGLTVTLDVEPDLPYVAADERRTKQVVANLLSNAVKFTPEGGRVDVSARALGGEVHVSVADTGIGIAPADQEAIFDAFQQISSRTAPPQEGTGLGLTLSRQLVELHGGTLSIESEVGVGSTFTFTLPVSRVVEPEAAPPAATVPPGPGEAIVLLVEDDQHSIDLLSLYLEDAGFTPVVARDGEEGLQLARRIQPAAILLDILLPRLDGWEFLERAKADPQIEHTPVIIVSMLDEMGAGLTLGAADYLVKPVGRDSLLQALRRAVALPSPATVLAIDDDPMALELVDTVLAPAGYQVLTARTGAEGIELARTHRPDVILLDLVMPELDGFGVLERLSEERTAVGIPIIILTSKTLTSDDKDRLRGRIAHLAQKTEFDRLALLELVRKCSPRDAAETWPAS
ncbi:MAG TPA: response regulator [Gaiellaceae bacterium]